MQFSIPEFLSDEHSLGIFFLVSVVMGGGAAWLAGRAIAATWRPWWHLALYMLLLSLAVRFLHLQAIDRAGCGLRQFRDEHHMLGALVARDARAHEGHLRGWQRAPGLAAPGRRRNGRRRHRRDHARSLSRNEHMA